MSEHTIRQDTPRSNHSQIYSPSGLSSSPTQYLPQQEPGRAYYAGSDAGSRWMTPSQSWTPALAPIAGSPSGPILEEVSEYDYGMQVGAEEDETTVAAHADLETGRRDEADDYGVHKPKSRVKDFVGGFVAALRNIPRIMLKNNPRGHPHSTLSSAAEQYPGSDEIVSPKSVFSQQGSPRLPTVQPSPIIPGTPFIENERAPTDMQDHGLSAESSTSTSTTHSTPASPTLPHRYTQYDSSAPIPHYDSQADPSVMSSPVQVDRQEISDYEKTQPPYPFTNPADDSWGSYISRIHRFFTDLTSLPWYSPQVVSDYVPEINSPRARHRNRPVEVSESWYKPKQKQAQDEMNSPALPPLPTSQTPSSSPTFIFQTIPPSTATHSGTYSYYTQRPSTRGTAPSASNLSSTPYTPRSHYLPSESGLTATRVRPYGTPASALTSAYGGGGEGFLPSSPGVSSPGNTSYSYSYYYPSPRQMSRFHSQSQSQSGFSAVSTPFTRLESDLTYTPR